MLSPYVHMCIYVILLQAEVPGPLHSVSDSPTGKSLDSSCKVPHKGSPNKYACFLTLLQKPPLEFWLAIQAAATRWKKYSVKEN